MQSFDIGVATEEMFDDVEEIKNCRINIEGYEQGSMMMFMPYMPGLYICLNIATEGQEEEGNNLLESVSSAISSMSHTQTFGRH
jgi:hypothetical protein